MRFLISHLRITVLLSHESTAWERFCWVLVDVGEFKAVPSSKKAHTHLSKENSIRRTRITIKGDEASSAIRYLHPVPVQRKRTQTGFSTQGSQNLYRDTSYTNRGKDSRSGRYISGLCHGLKHAKDECVVVPLVCIYMHNTLTPFVQLTLLCCSPVGRSHAIFGEARPPQPCT
jgi:hypothetical protein